MSAIIVPMFHRRILGFRKAKRPAPNTQLKDREAEIQSQVRVTTESEPRVPNHITLGPSSKWKAVATKIPLLKPHKLMRKSAQVTVSI